MPAYRPAIERFVEKFEIAESGCWLWAATTHKIGYGQFWDMFGVVPDGLELDHLCRVRRCVNPDHLEEVTHAENMARGQAGVWQLQKTHCPKGHPYDESNTHSFTSVRGYQTRRCRACSREAARRQRERART